MINNPECRFKVIIYYYTFNILINQIYLCFSRFNNICVTFSILLPMEISSLSVLKLFEESIVFVTKYQNDTMKHC